MPAIASLSLKSRTSGPSPYLSIIEQRPRRLKGGDRTAAFLGDCVAAITGEEVVDRDSRVAGTNCVGNCDLSADFVCAAGTVRCGEE